MREPVGGGRRGFDTRIHIYIYKEEGAVREPVGGGKTGTPICLYEFYIYI